MTGRDRVKRALSFQSPDRVPRDLWTLPAVTLDQREEWEEVVKRFPMDFGSAVSGQGLCHGDTRNFSRVGTYADEWGSVWEIAETGVVGEVKRPALADWSALARFKPPWDMIRQRDEGGVNRQCEASSLFMLSEVTARPFERLQFLRGTETLFYDLAEQSGELLALRERVHEYYLKDVSWWCGTAVDAVFMMDDWGTQQSLLIDPSLWRSFFKPLYRDYCELIHRAGKRAFFHSDGCIEAIFGDLIEAGMDAINSQLFCMDIETLSRLYKGKATFWGEMDRQRLLPFGSPEDVRQAVRRVRRAFDSGQGGVIAQCEWGKHNPKANIEAVYEAWQESERH